MTARGDVDLVLREWMAATAHVFEPDGLHDGVVARVPTIRQRPGWLAGRAARGFGRAGRVSARGMTLVAAATAITVAALVWSLMPGAVVPDASETPAPSTVQPSRPGMGRAEQFFPPFDYVIPEGSRLVPVNGDDHLHMIRWVVGAERGITVASGQEPWAHSPTGHLVLGVEPERVLRRLRELGKLDLGPVTPFELDGIPALATTVDDPEATDIHATNEGLPWRNYFPLREPCRLIVASVDGNVVFITIWARTAEERDAFTPTALEFVNSIDFDFEP